MNPYKTLSNHALIVGIAATFLSFTGTAASAAEGDYQFKADPAKVLGAENCKECHAPIFAAWEKTHHYASYNTMHRTDSAKAILKKMGMRSAKRDLCVQCHYTGQASGSRVKTISGTSCESCHGGGADWNKVHSNKEDAMALTKSEALGMIRPYNTYAVAANCFTCHTVPAEELINKGGHPAGSDFELVSWSQGEVRHNLQKTEGKQNTEAGTAHRRVLYVVGRILDLEHSIRALGGARGAGPFATKMTERVNRSLDELKKIQGAGVAVGVIVAVVDASQLKPGNAAALKGAADKIAKLGRAFSTGNDGSNLTGVDGLIPGADRYKGAPFQP